MELSRDKLYIIVRNDLAPGAQLAQSCHVAFSFSQEFPKITSHWMKESNYICVLSIENEQELVKLIDKARNLDLRFSIFRESDLEDQITAIALEPGERSRKLCRNLKLALK